MSKKLIPYTTKRQRCCKAIRARSLGDCMMVPRLCGCDCSVLNMCPLTSGNLRGDKLLMLLGCGERPLCAVSVSEQGSGAVSHFEQYVIHGVSLGCFQGARNSTPTHI
jgi:hypothetical protein